jgi:hypothetical protein
LAQVFIFATGVAYSQTTFSVATTEATAITSTSAALNGTINPGGNSTAVWFEWGTTTSLGTRSDTQLVGEGTSTISLTQTLRNLQPHTTYYFRAVSYRSSSGSGAVGDVKTFTTSDAPANEVLTVVTNGASEITSTSAVLNATINPGVTGSTAAGWFEWGTTTSLGTRTEIHTFSAVSSFALTQALRNLQPNTTYYFRAVAYRGENVLGNVLTFTTTSEKPAALTVTTNEASAVSSISAELRGLINPGGTAGAAWFEWGPTTALSNQTSAQSVTAGTTGYNYSYSLPGLQPSTTYYFRAVGQTSSTNAVRGDVRSFTTTRVASTAPQTTEVEQGTIKSGYVIITPDTSSGAPTPTMTYGTVSGGAVQSQAGIIPTSMATDASMFVEVIPSISRNIGVAIVNPGANTTAVTLSLRDENGILVGTPAVVLVPSHQQVAKFINEMFGSDTIGSGFRGSLRLQSVTPFAAVGLRFSGTVFSTLPLAVAAAVPGVPSMTLIAGTTPNTPQAGTVGGSTALIIPQFAIAGGWATQIVLVNNTNATIVGRIDLFDTLGNPMAVNLNGETRSTYTYSIPAGGTFVLAPRDSNGQSPL